MSIEPKNSYTIGFKTEHIEGAEAGSQNIRTNILVIESDSPTSGTVGTLANGTTVNVVRTHRFSGIGGIELYIPSKKDTWSRVEGWFTQNLDSWNTFITTGRVSSDMLHTVFSYERTFGNTGQSMGDDANFLFSKAYLTAHNYVDGDDNNGYGSDFTAYEYYGRGGYYGQGGITTGTYLQSSYENIDNWESIKNLDYLPYSSMYCRLIFYP